MPEARAEHYKREAEDCLAKARATTNPRMKDIWLQMARQYLVLAEVSDDPVQAEADDRADHEPGQ